MILKTNIMQLTFVSKKLGQSAVVIQYTEVRFDSFLSSGFTTMAAGLELGI